MVYRGHVENGMIVLDGSATLPEGATVQVTVLGDLAPEAKDKPIPTIFERLQPFIGKAEGLPTDASVNHDHYLYGVPKQS